MTHLINSPSKVRARSLAALAAAGLSALSLSACVTDDAALDPVAYADYHDRYPIVLDKAPATIDIFAVDGKLDSQSLASLHAFVARYQQNGGGRIAILAPSDRRNSGVVGAIRRALYSSGLRGGVAVGSYPNPDPTRVAPVRVMYATIVAEMPSQCGNFPTDLASGPDLRDWANLPYENYGCATQKMLAAQVDDPRDFARARAVSEPDVEMRLRAIDDVRKGQDPGTAWKIQNTAIGQVGGS
jgi:pilus assembly protein CpaD